MTRSLLLSFLLLVVIALLAAPVHGKGNARGATVTSSSKQQQQQPRILKKYYDQYPKSLHQDILKLRNNKQLSKEEKHRHLQHLFERYDVVNTKHRQLFGWDLLKGAIQIFQELQAAIQANQEAKIANAVAEATATEPIPEETFFYGDSEPEQQQEEEDKKDKKKAMGGGAMGMRKNIRGRYL